MRRLSVVSISIVLVVFLALPTCAKEISIWAQFYTPTKTMQVTPANPYPRQALKILAERYKKLTDITVKIIEKPGTQDDRQWILTQMAGGTIPDIC
ncbi:MAG: hypothetical protein N2380_06615, partial [bacterium]|nr:hypothetical protein [bacterium]